MIGRRSATSRRPENRRNDAAGRCSRRSSGRPRRSEWWSERRPGGRQIFSNQDRRFRRFHDPRGWLLRRNGPDGSIGQAVSATSARFVHAVGKHGLALQELERLRRPENAIAEPIGGVHRAVAIQANDLRLREVKIRVMAGDNGIAKHRVLKLLRVLHAAWNDGVRIHRAPNKIGGRGTLSGVRRFRRLVR